MSVIVHGRIGILTGSGRVSSQTITFPSLTPVTYGASNYSPGASAISGLPVSYSSSNLLVATIINNNIHIVGVGITNITATQAGNSHYSAATPIINSLTVNASNQTITFNALSTETLGTVDFSPASSSSGLIISYSSSNTAVATIVSGNIHIVGTGNTNITASQGGNSNYNAATPVVQPLTVIAPGLLSQTITFNTFSPVTYGIADFSPGATASSSLPVTYSSSNTSVATIVSNQIHVTGAGTTNITASQSGNSTYLPATIVIQGLTVNKANQTISFSSLPTQSVGNPDFGPGATTSSGLLVSYTSNNTSVATIMSGNIHIVAAGSSTITASQGGNSNYNVATPVNQLLIVSVSLFVNVDTSFEALVYNPIINHNYNILRPNISVIINSDTFISINNTEDTNTGQIEVTLTTGSENVYVNGISSFTKPTSPGTFTINYSNSLGVLTYN